MVQELKPYFALVAHELLYTIIIKNSDYRRTHQVSCTLLTWLHTQLLFIICLSQQYDSSSVHVCTFNHAKDRMQINRPCIYPGNISKICFGVMHAHAVLLTNYKLWLL